MSDRSEIAQAPTQAQQTIDVFFRKLCQVFALLSALLVVFIVLRIAVSATPAMQQYGPQFLTGKTWDPNKDQFGVLAEIWGTLYTSILALGLGTAFGVAAAVFLSEGYLAEAVFRLLKIFNLHFQPFWGHLPDRLELLLKNLIEVLA